MDRWLSIVISRNLSLARSICHGRWPWWPIFEWLIDMSSTSWWETEDFSDLPRVSFQQNSTNRIQTWFCLGTPNSWTSQEVGRNLSKYHPTSARQALHMEVLNWGYPQIIHFKSFQWILHCKQCIVGYLHFWTPPIDHVESADAAGVVGLLGRDLWQWPPGSFRVVASRVSIFKKHENNRVSMVDGNSSSNLSLGVTPESMNPKLTSRACALGVTSLSGSRGQVLVRHKIFVANAVHDWTSAHDEWLQKQAGAPWMSLVSSFW